MNAGLRLCASSALIFCLFLSCKASVNADANVSGQGASAKGGGELHGSAASEAEALGQGEGEGEMVRSANAPPTASAALAVATSASRVLLGARHDLSLKPGETSVSCACVSAAVADSHDAAMGWEGAAPTLDPHTQLSIALSRDEEQACKGAPKNSRGASYWGYRISGNDVIVVVEAARDGRPKTSGAIVPKPVGSGQVYLAPASKALPYGRGADGSARCKVGNPGAPRTEPFTPLELGQVDDASSESDAPQTVDANP